MTATTQSPFNADYYNIIGGALSIVKNELIQIRISGELKEILKKKAAEENRTLSNYIINVLQEKINSKK